VWMLENLKTTRYRNGDTILKVTDSAAWSNLSTGALCDYNNDANYSKTYGRLYNWYAVNDSRLIAPIGWHIPTDADWTMLTNYLKGDSVAGGKLKETGKTHWVDPNYGASNNTGFTAIPVGDRSELGTFGGVGLYDIWWSSSESDMESALSRGVFYLVSSLDKESYYKKNGFSVRCLRD
jgi:uncharacterized protein (TIGR02145 family)